MAKEQQRQKNQSWKISLSQKEELKVINQELLLRTVYLGVKLLILFLKLSGFFFIVNMELGIEMFYLLGMDRSLIYNYF